MTLIYYTLGFFTMVSVYALITSKLNQKAKCSHDWEEKGEGVLHCRKCNRNIQLQNTYHNENMAA